MRPVFSKPFIARDRYDAVLLDLDGVITDTANLHAACWKRMFDEYLQQRATERGEAFRPFDVAADYRLYVDGKPRFDGVRDFLIGEPVILRDERQDETRSCVLSEPLQAKSSDFPRWSIIFVRPCWRRRPADKSLKYILDPIQGARDSFDDR